MTNAHPRTITLANTRWGHKHKPAHYHIVDFRPGCENHETSGPRRPGSAVTAEKTGLPKRLLNNCLSRVRAILQSSATAQK